MATYQPASREERLARLKTVQEELAKVKTGFDSQILTLEQGTTIIRILPPVGNMNPNFYHQAVGYHSIGNVFPRCSEFTTGHDVKCPICEVIEVLRRSGAAGKELASRIKLSKKYWMNVVVRGPKDNFDTAEGPLVLKAGVTIFERTRSFVMDPDYGLIDDPETGLDIKIEKTGQQLKTEYQVNPRRAAGPLLSTKDGKPDWEGITKIMEAAQDLAPVVMPDNPDEDEEALKELGWNPFVKVYSYDRSVMTYGVSLDTIKQLEEIIAKNTQQNGDNAGEEGRYAQPQRGGSNSQSSRGGGNGADDIKARITAIRNKQ